MQLSDPPQSQSPSVPAMQLASPPVGAARQIHDVAPTAPSSLPPQPASAVRLDTSGLATSRPAVYSQTVDLDAALDTTAAVPSAPAAKKKRKWFQFSKRSLLVVVPLLLVLGAGGYYGADTWLAQHQSQPQLSPTAHAASGDAVKDSEGTDVSPVPVSALDNYVVAADLPRALTIDSLHISARILPMSVNKDNSMQAPVNINDSGWYTSSSKPGTPGAMVIDGHASATNSAVHLGLFSELGTLDNGDIVTVEKGDGTKLSYKVVYKETVALAAIDMKKVMLPYGQATEGLNLITCAGKWTNANTTLDHRTVVYTERIST